MADLKGVLREFEEPSLAGLEDALSEGEASNAAIARVEQLVEDLAAITEQDLMAAGALVRSLGEGAVQAGGAFIKSLVSVRRTAQELRQARSEG
tara:strand:- start:11824 stop:12105 length:282 start_codon:yes stop_codon:yes gene_type:complete